MTRYNYRQTTFERFAGGLPRVVIDARVRTSLAVLAAALLVVVIAAAAEQRRLAVLDGELTALRDRVAVAALIDTRDERVRATVLQERRVRTAVLAARRDSTLAANTIARIGNQLPPQTWLTSVQNDRTGAWSVAGRSTEIAEIGTTLAAIGRLAPASSPRLVSIASSGNRGRMLDFVIAWERSR